MAIRNGGWLGNIFMTLYGLGVVFFLRCCSVDLLLLMLTQHLEQELSSPSSSFSLLFFFFLFYNVTLLWVDKLFLSVTELQNFVSGAYFISPILFPYIITNFFFFFVFPSPGSASSLSLWPAVLYFFFSFLPRWRLQQQQQQNIARGGLQELYGI
jgi:hypothetical protein